MEQAKAAISSLLGKGGEHDTSVDETVAPGVTQEQTKPASHEEGAVTGSSRQTHETYESNPRPHNPALQSQRTDVDENLNKHDGVYDHQRALGTTGASTATTSGTSTLEDKGHSRIDSKLEGQPGMIEGESGSGIAKSQSEMGAAADPAAAGTAAGAYETDRHHDRDGIAGGQTSGESALTSSKPGAQATAGSYSTTDETRRTAAEAETDHSATVGRAGLEGTGHSKFDGSTNNTTTTETGVPQVENTSGISTKATETPSTTNKSTIPTQSSMADSTSNEPHHNSALANKLDPRVHNEGNKDSSTDAPAGNDAQHASLGTDPSVVQGKDKKLTGSGAPGSHSALFGLTPDGHKESKADYSGTGKAGPAHSKEDSTAASGEGATFTGKNAEKADVTTEDTGSRAPTGQGISEQLNDPRVAEKGHGGDSIPADASGKPGAGQSALGGEQGTGTVGRDA